MVCDTKPGSTIPLPIIAATCVETSAPTKLSPAAMTMALRIERARVEMQVAIAFAVSWNPFMKSKARAVMTTNPKRTRGVSTIFQRDPL